MRPKALMYGGGALIVAPWIWAFTLGRSNVGEAQGSGTAAFYASLITVPLGIVLIVWGLLKRKRAH